MISPDVPYRVGVRALIYMMLRNLKYPFVLAIIMIAVTFLSSIESNTLLSWQAGHSSLLSGLAHGIYATIKYGWIFTILLGLFLALIEIPEYMGLMFRLNDSAFYVRSGIISHKEIAIPYRQIQTIDVVEEPLMSLFGLCCLAAVTSARNDPTMSGSESEIKLPLIHKSLARELQNELLKRLQSTTA